LNRYRIILFLLLPTTWACKKSTIGPENFNHYKIVYQKETGGWIIATVNEDGSEQQYLTGPGWSSNPIWSPDGSKIAYLSNPNYGISGSDLEIYVMNFDGSDKRRLTSTVMSSEYSLAWSTYGNRIAFVSDRDGTPEIYVMNADGTDQKRQIAQAVIFT
jgi:Tol biopolymer transport system component